MGTRRRQEPTLNWAEDDRTDRLFQVNFWEWEFRNSKDFSPLDAHRHSTLLSYPQYPCRDCAILSPAPLLSSLEVPEAKIGVKSVGLGESQAVASQDPLLASLRPQTLFLSFI